MPKVPKQQLNVRLSPEAHAARLAVGEGMMNAQRVWGKQRDGMSYLHQYDGEDETTIGEVVQESDIYGYSTGGLYVATAYDGRKRVVLGKFEQRKAARAAVEAYWTKQENDDMNTTVTLTTFGMEILGSDVPVLDLDYVLSVVMDPDKSADGETVGTLEDGVIYYPEYHSGQLEKVGTVNNAKDA